VVEAEGGTTELLPDNITVALLAAVSVSTPVRKAVEKPVNDSC